MKTNRTETKGTESRGTWSLLAVISASVILCTGCSVLDSIDRQLVAWGVVDGIRCPGFDTLSVVEVDAGTAQGVGVILEGGMIFTANHVVRGADRAVVRTFGYYRDGYYQTLEARVIYRNREADQALLTILDSEDLDHTAQLGTAEVGGASVLPLRPAGASSFGYTVNKPVVCVVEITASLDRYAGNAQLRKGDSGAPIVQNGKVVGLVMGSSKIVAPDVQARYNQVLRSHKRSGAGGRTGFEKSIEKETAPECAKTTMNRHSS